jgi:hypothetical protein
MRKLVCLLFICPFLLSAQIRYWNEKTQLTPCRLPLVSDNQKIEFFDLDNDGDPDILKTSVMNGIPILWVDDDDDMKESDLEGDQDNDCLLVDRNKDGIFAGQGDLCIDWTDTNNDKIADIQLVVNNGNLQSRNFFDWTADFMYIIDYGEKDGIQNFINWNELVLRAWEHSATSNFYSDYHGNTLFLKMHASSFRISNLNYNWENPFIFYDEDKDELSEMAIRLIDTPAFRPKPEKQSDSRFNNINPERDALFTGNINWASIAWDIDNDNGQNNQFDFDMSLRFTGEGFNYADQVHKFKNLRGLVAADTFFYDPRWRQNDELIYTDPKLAYNKILKNGKWDNCWFVFDEDDDCNRWERVEFYEPKDVWKIGMRKGGLDNNGQADAIGDRGEFDSDNSGKGQLYIAPFDGRIHLYGAEWGAWRIDMNASVYQGYGGQYPPSKTPERLAKDPQKWATVKYSDTNNNGFIDYIEYDLDGDSIFEDKVSLLELNIDDKTSLINTKSMSYSTMNKCFEKLTNDVWMQSQKVIKVAKKQGLNTNWYAFWKQPRTLFEKYQYGYWLSFYLYKDMCHKALIDGNMKLKTQLDKAYYSGVWNSNEFIK